MRARTQTAIVAFVVLVFIAARIMRPRLRNGQAFTEQTDFSEGEPLQRPVALSPETLQALLHIDAVRNAMDFASDSEKKHPSQLFSASEIHLGSSSEVDLVVIGSEPISRADGAWFFVLRNSRHKPEIVLSDGANSLSFLKTRTNGLRDIGAVWASAGEVSYSEYRFDGKQYKLWKSNMEERPTD